MRQLNPGASERHFDNEVLVLGIGNILWADEGFGPRAAEAFHQAYAEQKDVRVMDGGTLGLYLSEYITSSRRILVFDCCELHAPAGTMKLLRKDDIRLWSSNVISAHQTGFNDLLNNAALLGQSPEDIAIIGVQPKDLEDYGGSLTAEVKSQIAPAVETAAEVLAQWGFAPQKRNPGDKADLLASAIVEMDPYEKGRPTEEEACRVGDERFMVRPAGHVCDPNKTE